MESLLQCPLWALPTLGADGGRLHRVSADAIPLGVFGFTAEVGRGTCGELRHRLSDPTPRPVQACPCSSSLRARTSSRAISRITVAERISMTRKNFNHVTDVRMYEFQPELFAKLVLPLFDQTAGCKTTRQRSRSLRAINSLIQSSPPMMVFPSTPDRRARRKRANAWRGKHFAIDAQEIWCGSGSTGWCEWRDRAVEVTAPSFIRWPR